MFFERIKTESFYKLSTILSTIAGVIFFLGFAGWIFKVSSLTDVDSGWSPIKPICSISGMLLVFSNLLILRRRTQNWFNVVLTILPLLMATISIIENVTNSSSALGDLFIPQVDFFPLS